MRLNEPHALDPSRAAPAGVVAVEPRSARSGEASGRRLVIHADAHVDGRPLALEPVYFPTLIGAYARAVRGAARVCVVAPRGLHEPLAAQLQEEGVAGAVELTESCEPHATDLVMDLREVQHPAILRKVVRDPSRTLPQPAWIISRLEDCPRAAVTLERHDLYVVARALVIPPARFLATSLLPTRVSPNTVTVLSCLFGVMAAVLPFLDGYAWRIAAALSIWLSITLDFTDGYLARLRGTDSQFGYWLDTLMDEVVKFALFVGMTGLVLRDGPGWALVPAIATLVFYHVLSCNHWLTRSLARGDITLSVAMGAPRWRPGLAGALQRSVARLTYLDIQLFVIAFALLAKLEVVALALYATIYCLSFARLLQVRLKSGRLD